MMNRINKGNLGRTANVEVYHWGWDSMTSIDKGLWGTEQVKTPNFIYTCSTSFMPAQLHLCLLKVVCNSQLHLCILNFIYMCSTSLILPQNFYQCGLEHMWSLIGSNYDGVYDLISIHWCCYSGDSLENHYSS